MHVRMADITYQLKKLFETEIEKPHLKSLFENVEMPLMYVLKDMEIEGVNIDVTALKKFAEELNEDLIRLKSEQLKPQVKTLTLTLRDN